VRAATLKEAAILHFDEDLARIRLTVDDSYAETLFAFNFKKAPPTLCLSVLLPLGTIPLDTGAMMIKKENLVKISFSAPYLNIR